MYAEHSRGFATTCYFQLICDRCPSLHKPAGSEAGNRDCREDAADEELALAVYFDQEMKLLCSLPAAARGLRRHLVADIAKVLRSSPFPPTSPIPVSSPPVEASCTCSPIQLVVPQGSVRVIKLVCM